MNEDTITHDVDNHSYKNRKKQSCQPKQIQSKRNAFTTFNSPKNSWANTFISQANSHRFEENKESKNNEKSKKTKIKMLRVRDS